MKSCEPVDFPQFGTLSEQKLTERAVKVASWIWESDADIPRDRRQSNDVNATIAVRLLCRVANKLRKQNGKGDLEKINISNLIHSFRYRDISKESVMALLEVLIEK